MRALLRIAHRPRLTALALATVLGALVAAPSRAATLTWGTSGTGGDGTWTATGGWWDGVGQVNWNSVTPDSAVFQGTPGTVTLGANVTSGSVLFTVDGYTITGNTLTLNSGFTANGSATVNSAVALGAGNSWSVAAGKTLTLGGVVSGAQTLTYGGSGTYALNGINTNSGNLTISGATVNVATGATLFGSGLGWSFRSVTLSNGGSLRATNWANGAGNLWGQIGDGSNNIIFGTGGGTFIMSGTVMDSTVNKGFDVSANVSGTFFVPAGVSTEWQGSNSSRDFNVNSGGTLVFSGDGNFTTSRYLRGAGGVTKSGVGKLALTQNNTFTGSLTINSGTLDAASTTSGNQSAIGDGATNVTVNSGGTLLFSTNRSAGFHTGSATINGGTIIGNGTDLNFVSGNTLTFATSSGTFSGTGQWRRRDANNRVVVQSAASGSVISINELNLLDNSPQFDVADGVAAADLTISGSLSGGATLVKAGAGTLRLSAVNSNFTGPFTIDAGTVEAAATTSGGNPSSIGGGSNGITINSGGALAFTASRGAGFHSGAVTINGGTLTFNASDISLASGNTITLGTSAATINGSGQWRMRGSATMRVLAAANGSTISVSDFNILDGTETFNIDSGATLTVSSSMSGGGNLLKTGSGTMVLSSAASTYNTTTTVRAGTLVAGANAPSGANGAFGNSSGAILVGDGSTGAADAPGVLIGGAFTVGRAISIGSASNANAFAPVLGGTNTVGTATFSGNVTLNTTASGYTGVLLRASPGGTVDFSGTWTTNNKPITVGSAGNTGTVRLSSAMATTGGVTVNAGTLLLNTASALGSTTPLTLAAATTLDVAGLAAGIGTLSGSGTITGTTGGVLAVTQAANGTYSGVITGGVGLTKAGGSTLTLAGVNTYSGATTVNSGTLALPSAASIGSSAVTVANAAVLAGSGTAGATTVMNGGILAPGDSGTGILTLSALTFGTAGGDTANVSIPTNFLTTIPAKLQVNGDVVANGGTNSVTFAFGSLALLPSGTYGLITYTGSLASGTAPFTYTGSLSGRQGVNFDNSGGVLSLVISNAFPIWSGTDGTGWWATNNWALNTTGSATTFLDTDTVFFTDAGTAGTVSISGSNVVPSTVTFSSATNAYTLTSPDGFGIAGGGNLLKSGAATVTIANTNSFSGGTIVSAGTLIVTGSGGLGSGGVTVSNALLTFSGAGSLESGAVTLSSGTIQMGSVAALGSGTVTVNGGLLSSTGSGSLGSGPLTLNAGTVRAGGDTALGSGTVTLNGGVLSSDSGTARSLANPVSIGGSVALGDATNNGHLTLSGAVNLGGATRSLTTPSNVTLSGSVTNGSLTKAGAGLLSLTGGVSLSGATTITGGTLQLGGGAVINAGSYASGIDIASGAVLAIATSANQTLAGVISGSGALIKSGAGTLTLNASNTYAGTTTVSQGTLRVGSGGTAGSLASSVIVNNANLVYDFSSSGAVTLASGSTTGSGNLSVTARDINLGGAIALGTSGSVTITQVGAGTFPFCINLGGSARTISGSSISLAGDVGNKDADGGSLTLDTSAANGPISLDVSLGRSGVTYIPTSLTANAGTGTISVVGTGPAASGWRNTPVTLTGRMNITANVNSAQTVTLNETTATGTVSGALSGVMSLVKGGTGTLTLTAVNTYTGQTLLRAGTLVLAGGQFGSGSGNGTNRAINIGVSAGENATFTVSSGTISQSGGAGLMIGDAGSGTFNQSGGSVTLGSNGLWLGDNSGGIGTANFSGGTFTNTGETVVATRSQGTINVSGSATVSLATLQMGYSGIGVSSQTANVNLEGGTLAVNSITRSSGSGNLYFNGGTLKARSSTASFMAGLTAAQVKAGGAVIDTDGFAITIGQAINENPGSTGGGLTKLGSGTLTLSAVNGFTGPARVNAGTLAIGASNSLQSAASIFVAQSAVLDASAAGLTVVGGQTLGGYGTVQGNATFQPGGILSPGGSIGTVDVTGAAIWSGSSAYLFEVTSGTAVPNVGWDLFTTGSLSITATTGDPYRILLTSLTTGTSQTPGAMTAGNWDPDTSYQWLFVDTANPIASFDPTAFTFDGTDFLNAGDINNFSVVRGDALGQSDTDLYVVYTAVPEPGTLALAGIGVVGAAYVLRRRARRGRAT